MTSARDIMSTDTTCIGENDTLSDTARLMRELGVGSLPVCGEDERLNGMVTDRDIVVKCIAAGNDPGQTRAGDLALEELDNSDDDQDRGVPRASVDELSGCGARR